MRSEEKQHGHEDTERAENDGLPVTHGPVDDPRITIGNGIETLVDRRKQYIVKLALLLACTEHSRTKHRHQTERTQSGHDHDNADDPSELAEHDT